MGYHVAHRQQIANVIDQRFPPGHERVIVTPIFPLFLRQDAYNQFVDQGKSGIQRRRPIIDDCGLLRLGIQRQRAKIEESIFDSGPMFNTLPNQHVKFDVLTWNALWIF